MKTCRFVGLAAVLLAGCAGHPRPTTMTSAKPIKPTSQPTTDEPKWEATAGPTASELLAEQAKTYAKTVQNAQNAASPAAVGDPVPPRLNRSPNRLKPAEDAHSTAVAVESAPAQPASVRFSPRADTQTDFPKRMPESDDFQTPQAKTPQSDPLGLQLRKRVMDNPRDIANQLDLQLYGMLTDDPVGELATISALPNDDREMVSALVDGLSNFRSTVRQDGNALAAQKIKPLLEMADRLRSQADLLVPTVALCSRVDGYGKYTPILPARFPAGRDNPAIVYCEVENFLTKQNSQQMWQTRLSEQVTLYTVTGMLAWSDNKHEVMDECRNRRRDFFAYNVIHLPKHLTLGQYLLKVSINDENAGRVAEATVPVSITAQEP